MAKVFDPYENRVPFGLLSARERTTMIGLAQGGRPIECIENGKWIPREPDDGFAEDLVYRPVRHTVTIPWEHILRGFNYIAKDYGGDRVIFDSEPWIEGLCWVSSGREKGVDGLEIREFSRIPWEESLHVRPAYG
ncbi:MAG: hypothetical protein OXD36_04720 [Rhodobacter sp.]|nr:hypothetical protein [Rhodobacter sp.]